MLVFFIKIFWHAVFSFSLYLFLFNSCCTFYMGNVLSISVLWSRSLYFFLGVGWSWSHFFCWGWWNFFCRILSKKFLLLHVFCCLVLTGTGCPWRNCSHDEICPVDSTLQTPPVRWNHHHSNLQNATRINNYVLANWKTRRYEQLQITQFRKKMGI